MIGLAPHTTAIFEKAIQLECIKPYFLVGGTALSLQLGTRLSEDLDFMRWRSSKNEKMEVMFRRSNFRDYYDIYSIVKSGIDIHELITKATNYSLHQLKTKNIQAMLTNSRRFMRDSSFNQMQPLYNVSALEIENYFRGLFNSSSKK